MTKMLDEMNPFEDPVLEFDFTGDLVAVDSAVVSVSPGGVDLLDGAYQIVGAVVYQRVKSAVAVANAVAAGALTSDGLIVASTPGYIVSRTARNYKVSRVKRAWRIAA